MTIREEILQKLRDVYRTLSPGEQAVAKVLATASGKLTQQDIAKSEPFLGAHPQFEGYSNKETTLRRVRQIIHDLKVQHGIVIVSDTKGYWIPNTLAEAEEYIDGMERQARSAAKSYMVTFNVMLNAISGLTRRNVNLFGEEV